MVAWGSWLTAAAAPSGRRAPMRPLNLSLMNGAARHMRPCSGGALQQRAALVHLRSAKPTPKGQRL
jgi:hypothetical protein